MSMTASSAQYFTENAGQWDSIRTGYFTEAVRETAIQKAYLRPEYVVADVGAGTGFMAAGLAPLVSKVIVLDGSAAMLDVARRNLANFGDKVEYHTADGQALPLPDASLDAVFANMYLHHCPDPAAAIREMVRVLKPGGRMVLTDMDSHPYTWFKEEMADEWLGFERSQIKTWLQQADLVNVLVDCTGQSCCAESLHPEARGKDEQKVSISVFVAAGTRRVAMRDSVQQTYSDLAIAQGESCGCGGGGDCCSSSADRMNFAGDYSADEKAAVPSEAGEFSLGCGNPFAMATLKAGQVVLDIGSGGGMDSFLAASKVGASGRVIGVDMTPAMLERARASALKAGINNVEFREGHAENLPVQDGAVDVVISNCVVNLVEDKARVFGEAFRVLKPGGRLELSDVVTSGPVSEAARLNSAEWAGCVSGALPEAEYLDLVEQAGFREVRSRRSVSSGMLDGVDVYSVIVSAEKPAAVKRTCCG